MFRVLVVEDSPVSRELITHLLTRDPQLKVAAVAGDGREAVRLTQELKPDVILMDVHMPHMNGLEATREIMRTTPTPIVVMSATSVGTEAAMVFEATQAGALTFVQKPGVAASDQDGARRLVEMVKAMAEVKVIGRRRQRSGQPPEVAPLPTRPSQEARLVAIGASTGGPPALMAILKALPRNFALPVVMVQHITPGFTEGLATWLASASSFDVKVAKDGEVLQSGRAYLPPDGVQIVVSLGSRIRLVPRLAEQIFCPSIDRLFESVAEVFGPAALGIVLTGMGRDGAEGLRRMRESGGVTIAQDEATSAVFGMPKEAVRLKAATHVLPLTKIADAIVENMGRGD
ncbi:MAG: chemotaxis-specific protein-glutamate methyltransferase CheB [Sulfobacillus sp.]